MGKCFKRLSNLSLIQEQKETVICDDVYFHKVIEIDLDIKECLKTAVNIFSEDFDSLIQISNRCYERGLIREKRQFMKISITSLLTALKIMNEDTPPTDYTMTKNNLGNAYSTLAEVEDKSSNCKNAIHVYEEALEVRTLAEFPMQYATTKNNLGTAYRTLAEVEDKSYNCKKAIHAYEEALKVYDSDRFPEIDKLIKRNLDKTIEFCKNTNQIP